MKKLFNTELNRVLADVTALVSPDTFGTAPEELYHWLRVF